MQQLTTFDQLIEWRLAQQGVALVPTMGALHQGHQALIEKARTLADQVIVSLFVNPTQFGPQEDLSRYPRTLDADLALCETLGVSAVYTPTANEMYPGGADQTMVTPPTWLTEAHCGLERPGHFTGVATIVLKLFMLIQPQVAVFGEKDAQQLAVIQHMVADLNLPVEIVPVPTVREPSGLAMSSRNRYLTTPGSQQAALILIQTFKALHQAWQTAVISQGPHAALTLQAVNALKQQVRVDALKSDSLTTITWDYLNMVAAHTFKPKNELTAGTRLLGAIRLKEGNDVNVRLIDNWLIG
jgi:pantoate--beta-alanine ligase